MKKVVIAGGTGFIGSYLASRFKHEGYEVYIVSRSKNNVSWLPTDLIKAIDGSEMVINLAGKTINCLHTEANKKKILQSRINASQMIGKAILNCKMPPPLWINASGTAIYKPSHTKAMTEDETNLDKGFLSNVIEQWEKAMFDFDLTYTRQIALRTSVVLGKKGGALQPFLWLVRMGLGGHHANGKQIFSWIHVEDYFQILLFLERNKTMNGIVNCTAPCPLPNKEFMQTLRKKLHMPFGLPAPELAIKIGAKLIGTEPSLLLNSSYVIPKRLTEVGFKFKYPNAESALENLLALKSTKEIKTTSSTILQQ